MLCASWWIQRETDIIIFFENSSLWVRSVHAGFMGMQHKYNQERAAHACRGFKCPSGSLTQRCCVSGKKKRKNHKPSSGTVLPWLALLPASNSKVFSSKRYQFKLIRTFPPLSDAIIARFRDIKFVIWFFIVFQQRKLFQSFKKLRSLVRRRCSPNTGVLLSTILIQSPL
jgi:hypothetical protein